MYQHIELVTRTYPGLLVFAWGYVWVCCGAMVRGWAISLDIAYYLFFKT